MIVDCHAHLEEEIPVEKVIRLMDRDGIQRATVFAPAMESIPSTPDRLLAVFRFLLRSRLNPLGTRLYNKFVRKGHLMVSGKSYRIFQDPDNETVGKAVLQHPDRLIFFAFINPRGPRDPLEVIEECNTKFELKGVKTHSWFHEFDPSSDLIPVEKRCQELNIPLLIHLGGSPETGNIEGLMNACPRLNVVLAHLGIPYFQKIWHLLDRYPNLYMDISGPYLNAGMVREGVGAVGSSRLLFGTDAPYGLRTPEGYSFEPIKQWTLQLEIPEKEKEDILSGNYLRLLGD